MIPCQAVDSTGVKVEGGGALSAACLACACRVISGTRASIPLTHASLCYRAAGGSKRRPWRKIHIGIDEETLEIRAVEVTSSDIGPSWQIALQSPAGQCMICASLNRAVFIKNLLRYLAEKILLLNTTNFRGGLPLRRSVSVGCGQFFQPIDIGTDIRSKLHASTNQGGRSIKAVR